VNVPRLLKASTKGGPGAATPGATAVAGDTAGTTPAEPDPELQAQRERLTERFALMQSELGGLFYEMAIRDHVRMEVLIDKAAALQRVDTELGQVEHLLSPVTEPVGGKCPNCGTPYARGAAYCSQCATALAAG
jgi:hypothetical protein